MCSLLSEVDTARILVMGSDFVTDSRRPAAWFLFFFYKVAQLILVFGRKFWLDNQTNRTGINEQGLDDFM